MRLLFPLRMRRFALLSLLILLSAVSTYLLVSAARLPSYASRTTPETSQFTKLTANEDTNLTRFTHYWLLSNAPDQQYLAIYAPHGANITFSGTNPQPVTISVGSGEVLTVHPVELGYNTTWFFMDIHSSAPILCTGVAECISTNGPSVGGCIHAWLPDYPLSTELIAKAGTGVYDDFIVIYAPSEAHVCLKLYTPDGDVLIRNVTVSGIAAYYCPDLFDGAWGILRISSDIPIAAIWTDNPTTGSASRDQSCIHYGQPAEPYRMALATELVHNVRFQSICLYTPVTNTISVYNQSGQLVSRLSVNGDRAVRCTLSECLTSLGTYFGIIKTSKPAYRPAPFGKLANVYRDNFAFFAPKTLNPKLTIWANRSSTVILKELFSNKSVSLTIQAYNYTVIFLNQILNISDSDAPLLVAVLSDTPILCEFFAEDVHGSYHLRPYPAALIISEGGGGEASVASDVIVAIGSPADDSRINTRDVLVHWVAYPMDLVNHFEVRLDAEAWIDTGLNTTFVFCNVSEGEHAVAVRAYDLNGSYAYDVTYFIVDLTAPWVEIVQPENGSSIHHDHVTVTWVAGDPGSSWIDHFEVRCDTSDWIYVGRRHSYKFTDLSSGWHVFTVRAYDPAGNYAEDSVWVYVKHHHSPALYYLPLLTALIPATAFVIAYRRKRF